MIDPTVRQQLRPHLLKLQEARAALDDCANVLRRARFDAVTVPPTDRVEPTHPAQPAASR